MPAVLILLVPSIGHIDATTGMDHLHGVQKVQIGHMNIGLKKVEYYQHQELLKDNQVIYYVRQCVSKNL